MCDIYFAIITVPGLASVSREGQGFYRLVVVYMYAGTPLSSTVIDLQLIVCNSLLQVELLLVLMNEFYSADYGSICYKQLIQRCE